MNAVPVEIPQAAARRLSASALREGFKPVALHAYCDADGHPVLWRIRLKHPDGRKWIRPMHWDGTGYVIGEPEAPPQGKLLYRLPDVLADATAPVWIVEGEACADALHQLGIIATTSGSASSADAADWTPLQGRSVSLWPDHDAAGAKYADAVTAILLRLGCTVERIDVAALNLPAGGDVVDWLAAHPNATTDDVLSLPKAQSLREPEPASGAARVLLVNGAEVRAEAVRWLWDGWLASGKLHLIGGQPGTGKTTIAIALAATVTIGGRWPDGTRAECGSVAIWSGEDDIADTLAPRLRAAGADMSRIRFVQGVSDKGERYPFDPATDTALLADALAGIADLRLLVIDPIVSAVAGDSHKNAEVRRSLQPLVDLAQQHRCALLGVTHFTKGTAGREPVERITGSLAFGALARLVLVAAKQDADGDTPARRVLLRAKSNIGPDGGGFVYGLSQASLPDDPAIIASSVLWGEAVAGSARDLLAEVEQRDDDELNEQRDATDWLWELLEPSPMPVKDVKRQADESGFAWRTVQRAMRRAGVESRRGGFGQPATWRLASCATAATVAPVAPHKLSGANGANGESGGANAAQDGWETVEL